MATTQRRWPLRLGDGRKKYDWEKWLDGQVWKLTKGKDFTVKRGSFVNAGRDYAKRHKVTVRIAAPRDEEKVVYLQANPDK